MRSFLGILLLLAVAGCSRSAVNEEPVTLRLMSAGGYNRTAEEEAVARFRAKNPGIQVEFMQAPGRDYYVKALATIAAGSDLDVLWMGSGFGLFSWRDALLPLDDFLRDDADFSIGLYQDAVVDWYRHRGVLLGLPYGIDVQAMVYNRAAFDVAGLPYPTPDWTFDEYVEMARRLTAFGKMNAGACRYGAGVDKIAPHYFGVSLLSEDGAKSGFHGKAAREWLDTNVKLLRGERSFLRVGAQGTLDRLSEFLQGRVAMVEAYSWDVGDLRDRARFPWVLMVNPLGRDGQRAGWASSSGFAISAKTKYPRVAWHLLKELVGAEMQVKLMATTVPARTDLQARYLETNDIPGANLSAFLEMLPYVKIAPRIPELLEVSQENDYWFELALQGDDKTEDIMDRLEHSTNLILSTSPARQ